MEEPHQPLQNLLNTVQRAFGAELDADTIATVFDADQGRRDFNLISDVLWDLLPQVGEGPGSRRRRGRAREQQSGCAALTAVQAPLRQPAAASTRSCMPPGVTPSPQQPPALARALLSRCLLTTAAAA